MKQYSLVVRVHPFLLSVPASKTKVSPTRQLKTTEINCKTLLFQFKMISVTNHATTNQGKHWQKCVIKRKLE